MSEILPPEMDLLTMLFVSVLIMSACVCAGILLQIALEYYFLFETTNDKEELAELLLEDKKCIITSSYVSI